MLTHIPGTILAVCRVDTTTNPITGFNHHDFNTMTLENGRSTETGYAGLETTVKSVSTHLDHRTNQHLIDRKCKHLSDMQSL